MEGHYHYLIQSSLARDACWTAGCQSTAPAFGRLQNSVVPLAGEEQTLPCACSSSETRFCSSFIPSPDLEPQAPQNCKNPGMCFNDSIVHTHPSPSNPRSSIYAVAELLVALQTSTAEEPPRVECLRAH